MMHRSIIIQLACLALVRSTIAGDIKDSFNIAGDIINRFKECSEDRCGAGCTTLQCAKYCTGPSCGTECDEVLSFDPLIPSLVEFGCAYKCKGSQCGTLCKSNNCAYKCEGEDCGAVCSGANCALKCTGTACGAKCMGPGCGEQCSGDNCACECTGSGCGKDCTGKDCGPGSKCDLSKAGIVLVDKKKNDDDDFRWWGDDEDDEIDDQDAYDERLEAVFLCQEKCRILQARGCEILNCGAAVAVDCPVGCGAPRTGCFPGDAQVELQNGTEVTMSALNIGDSVRVGASEFSEIFLFTHRDADVKANVFKISTSTGKAIRLTGGHYLFVNGQLQTARTVKLGDMVSSGSVTAIDQEWTVGLYNPHTMTGDIVVDGVLASTYTDAVAPSVAHALFWPVRMLYNVGLLQLAGASESDGWCKGTGSICMPLLISKLGLTGKAQEIKK